METQDIRIGTELQIVAARGLNHFRHPNSAFPLCGASVVASYSYRAFVVSSALLQTSRMMHRVKAKTDCLGCAQKLFNAIHHASKETPAAGSRGCAIQAP